jgi:hypothetical protein
MVVWELVPRQGIRTSGIDLLVGMDRAAARDMLAGTMGDPVSHFPDEDDFRTDETLIRLRYDDETLTMVEFLRGDLRLDGIPLHAGTNWPTLAESLAAKEFRFESAGFLGDGKECGSLGVNIATHEDVGGDGDGIEWVIVSPDIT